MGNFDPIAAATAAATAAAEAAAKAAMDAATTAGQVASSTAEAIVDGAEGAGDVVMDALIWTAQGASEGMAAADRETKHAFGMAAPGDSIAEDDEQAGLASLDAAPLSEAQAAAAAARAANDAAAAAAAAAATAAAVDDSGTGVDPAAIASMVDAPSNATPIPSGQQDEGAWGKPDDGRADAIDALWAAANVLPDAPVAGVPGTGVAGTDPTNGDTVMDGPQDVASVDPQPSDAAAPDDAGAADDPAGADAPTPSGGTSDPGAVATNDPAAADPSPADADPWGGSSIEEQMQRIADAAEQWERAAAERAAAQMAAEMAAQAEAAEAGAAHQGSAEPTAEEAAAGSGDAAGGAEEAAAGSEDPAGSPQAGDAPADVAGGAENVADEPFVPPDSWTDPASTNGGEEGGDAGSTPTGGEAEAEPPAPIDDEVVDETNGAATGGYLDDAADGSTDAMPDHGAGMGDFASSGGMIGGGHGHGHGHGGEANPGQGHGRDEDHGRGNDDADA